MEMRIIDWINRGKAKERKTLFLWVKGPVKCKSAFGIHKAMNCVAFISDRALEGTLNEMMWFNGMECN